VAAALFDHSARRIRPMAVFRNAAITCATVPFRTCE
jgi:hypothetical protein